MRRLREEEREMRVVYDDEALWVIDKPAGMVISRRGTTKGACHRLDKETSGLLIMAKTAAAFANIQRQFKQRRIKKKYLALVHGIVKPQAGKISFPIARNPFNRKKFGVFLGGREAETRYKTISNFADKQLTLLEVTPLTGRTHQIRVHLKQIGHPLVADPSYAGRKQARADKRWCKRQFLHASYLQFSHPITGKAIKFSAPLPADLKQALSHLAKS